MLFGSVYFVIKTMHGAKSERKRQKSKNNTSSNYTTARKPEVRTWRNCKCNWWLYIDRVQLKQTNYKIFQAIIPSLYSGFSDGRAVGCSIIFRLSYIYFRIRTHSKNYEIDTPMLLSIFFLFCIFILFLASLVSWYKKFEICFLKFKIHFVLHYKKKQNHDNSKKYAKLQKNEPNKHSV